MMELNYLVTVFRHQHKDTTKWNQQWREIQWILQSSCLHEVVWYDLQVPVTATKLPFWLPSLQHWGEQASVPLKEALIT